MSDSVSFELLVCAMLSYWAMSRRCCYAGYDVRTNVHMYICLFTRKAPPADSDVCVNKIKIGQNCLQL